MFYVAGYVKEGINRFRPGERQGKRFREFENAVEPNTK
jgi:hypothetical protein